MSNSDLLVRLIDCWNTGKLEAIDELLSPDFVRHEPEMGGGTTRNDDPFVFEGVNILRIEGNKVVEDWIYFDATAVRGRLAHAQSA